MAAAGLDRSLDEDLVRAANTSGSQAKPIALGAGPLATLMPPRAVRRPYSE